MDVLITIGAALISAGASIVVCVLNNRAQQKKQDIEQDKRMTEIEHKNEKMVLEMKAAHKQGLSEMSAQMQQTIAVLDCKFDDLRTKVEKHNGLIEKTYKLESDMLVVHEKIAVANHRIDDLERR